MSIKIEIDLIEASSEEKSIKFEVVDNGDVYTFVENDEIWNTNNIKHIKLSTKDDEGNYLAEIDRFAGPAHELGHALGLSDLYGYKKEKDSYRRLQPLIYDISKTTQNEIWYKASEKNPDGDLMYNYGLVRANDIEMILQAYCVNQKQYFKLEFDKENENEVSNEPSKVIKQNQNNIYLDRLNKEFVIYDPESKTITSIGDVYAYQTLLKDNYGINVTIIELEKIYGKGNITSS